MGASIIICDDIRQEASGKLMLIGIYSSILVPAFLPRKLALATFCRVSDSLLQGSHVVRVTHKHEHSDQVSQLDGNVQITDEQGLLDIPFPILEVDAPQPGYITTIVQIGDKEYKINTYVSAPPTTLGPLPPAPA